MKLDRICAGTLCVFLFFIGLVPLMGQEVEEPNEKAARYHALLLKKPGNAMVFGRFVDAWLDTGSKDGLTGWLEGSAKAGTAADWRVLGALHEYMGEDEEALKALNEAVKLDEESADLRLSRAKLQARLLAFEAALVDLEVAAKDKKTAIEASKLKGVYLARSGQVEAAVTAWKEVIAAYPKDEELREDLIEVEVMEGLYEDAIEASTALVAMTKDPYQKILRQLRLGDIQILGGDREAGLKTYQSIMAATGEGTWLEREVLAQVERVFLREDDVKGLRDFYQKLREEYPRRVSIRKVLARQMALNDEITEAIALFREVLKITPGDVGNREEFVAFLEANEKWKEAKEELGALLEQREDDALLWERLARIEAKLNDVEGAKVALAKVAELRKGDPEGLLAAATLYEQAKLLKEAETLLREGRTSFPDSLEVAEGMASFLVQNEKEAEALEIWKGMAEGADREGLLRVARSLNSHGKGEVAFEILGARVGEFENDPLILTQYCQLASTVEEATKAIPQGLALVRGATAPTELEGSIATALRLVARAEKREEVRASLSEKAETGVAEQCLLAALFAEDGDTVKAEEVLTKAGESPEGLLARFYRVRFEEKRGNLEVAIAMMRTIIELPEGRKTVHQRRLVDLLEKSGDYEKALAAVDDWKRIAPGDQAAWTHRAKLLLADGRPDDAVVELRRMAGKFGADEDSRASLASALIEAAEYTAAQRIYEQLYQESEKLETKLKWAGELAQLAQTEGKMAELLEDFDRRKRSNPRSVAPLLALAEIHRVLDQYEERRSALLEASRRRPEDTDLLGRIAEVEERAGEFDRAVGILRDAVKRDKTPKSKRRLAGLLFKNGEVQSGLDLLSEIPGTVDDPRGLETIVQSLITASEFEQAAKFLEKHATRHVSDWRLKYLSGMVQKLEGNDEKALAIFTDLLKGGEEIPNLKPLVPANAPSRNMGPWNTLFGSNGWSELAPYQGYLVQRNFSGGASRAPKIGLPGTPRESQLLSLLQGSSLLSRLPEKEAEVASKALSLPGINDVDVLSEMMSGGGEEFMNVLLQRSKEQPENKGLFALSLIYKSNMGGVTLAEFEKAEEMLLEDNAQTFAMIALNVMRSPEITAERMTQGLRAACEGLIGDERDEMMQLMSMYVFGGFGMDQSKDLTELKNFMAEEALANVEMPKDWSWMVPMVRQFLAQDKGDEALVMLNRLCEWQVKSKGASQPNSMMRIYSMGIPSGGGNSLVPPSFPPRSLKGVPGGFLALFPIEAKKTENEMDERAKLLAQLQLGEDKSGEVKAENGLKGRVGEIKNSGLQALAYLSMNEEEKAKKLIEEMAVSRDEGSLLFAAGYFHDRDDPRAYEVLLKLRMLPLSRTARKAVDGNLAFLGGLYAEDEESKVDLEPAKRAALRLRRVVSVKERKELGEVLVKLGLEKEAKRLEATPAPALTTRGGGMRSRNQPDRIDELKKEGNIDGASREAAKQFRGLVSRSGNDWELDQLVEKLTSKDLRKATLERLDPGETESSKRLMEFAKAQQLIGDPKVARGLYEKVLKKNPNLTAARVGMLQATPFEDIKEADLMVQKDGKLDAEASGIVFADLWEAEDDRSDFESLVNLMNLTAAFLEKLEPEGDAKRNLSWVPYHVLDFVTDGYFGEIRLSPLVDDGSSRGGSDDKSKEMTAKRNEVAKRVFLAMARHPQIAEQGFMLLEAGREGLELKPEELRESARVALLSSVKMPERGSNSFFGGDNLWSKRTGTGSTSSGELLNPVEPLSWLMANPLEVGGEALSPEFLEKIREARPEKFALMDQARVLGKGTPEEADKVFAEWKEALPVMKSQKALDFARQVLLFTPKNGKWADELETLMLGTSTDGFATFSIDRTKARTFVDWGKWRYGVAGEETYQAFVLRLFEAAFGPSDKWSVLAELGEDNLPSNYRQAGYSFRTISELLLGDSDLAKPTLQFLGEHPLEEFVYDLDDAISGAWGPRYGSAEGSLKMILQNRLLELTPKGDEVVKPTPRDVFSVVAGVGGIQFSNAERERKKLSESLAKAKGLDPILQKFASASLLNTKEARKMILPVLEENLELVKGMIAASPEKSFVVLRKWFPKMENEEISDSLKGVFAEFAGSARAEKRAVMTKQIEEGVPGFIQKGADDVWDEVLSMVPLDEELGEQLVLKVLNDVKAAPEPRGTSSSNGVITLNRDRWAQELISRLRSEELELDLAQRVRLIDAVYHDGVSDFLSEPMGLRAYNSTWAWSTMIGDDKAGVRSIPDLLAALDDREKATLAVLISDGALSPRSEDYDRFVKHKSLLVEGSPVLGSLFELVRNYRAAKGDKAGAPFGKARGHYLELLKSEDLPTVLKVDLLARMMSRSPEMHSDEEVLKVMPVMMKDYASTDRNLARSSLNKSLTTLGELDLKKFGKVVGPLVDETEVTLLSKKTLAFLRNPEEPPVLGAVIKLALMSDRTKLAAKLLRKNYAQYRGQLEIILKLAEVGDFEVLRKLIASGTGIYNRKGLGFYDQALHELVAKVLEEIPEESRYHLEVVLADLGDVPKGKGTAFEPLRVSRMTVLAQAFQKRSEKLKGDARLQVLAMFADQDETSAIVEKELREVHDRLTIADSFSFEQNSSQISESSGYQILRRVMGMNAAAGNFEPVIAKLEEFQELLKGDGNQIWQLRYQMDSVYGFVAQKLVLFASRGADKAELAMGPVKTCFEVALKEKGDADPMNSMDGAGLIVYALAGRDADWKTVVESLKGAEKQRYDKEASSRGYSAIFEDIFDHEWKIANRWELRRKMIRTLLNSSYYLEREIEYVHDFYGLSDSGLGNFEQVVKEVEALPKDHPAKVEATFHIASLKAYKIKGRNGKKAVAAYDEALALAREIGTEEKVNQIQAHRCDVLYRNNRKAIAKKEAAKIKVDLLPERDQKWVKKALPKWLKG